MAKFDRRTENLISEFRGMPKRNPKGRVKVARTAESLMDGLVEKFKLVKPRVEAELMAQWGYIMGEHNAHRCAPQRIDNGVLRIACAHPALMTELRMNKKMILRRALAVCPTLRDIKFVIG